MNIGQIEKLLKEAKNITKHDEYVIIGSLSVLGVIDNPPEEIVMSVDVDLYIKNDPNRTPEIGKDLGQGSDFDELYGYYANPVTPSLGSFPENW